ncbi:sec-independent protein translocase protein TATB, chloroplastic isoform X1 [Corylus avellana]|uniref:sec-independent protein translocase protein TATB, chloroplastic isoform X1 n=1 Tax=Corylus avellana TaxID=13451 RepID=UPI00286B72E6|nr:sec-independent protein translocase protein TATB, chloroplastic isoform X1 [Corylus avellana]
MVMASAICTPTFSSPSSAKSVIYSVSSSHTSHPKTPKFHLSKWVPPLGLSIFSPWSGLKHLGISITPKPLNSERKERCKGKMVYASLFGVGAPEALVIGVVALLVFGPKGLAEVARNLGKTLRAFQPTIRELQEVSRDFKSTLEREIGLDDISTENKISSSRPNATSTPSSTTITKDSQTVVDPNGASSPNRAYTTEEYLKITEEQLKASAAQQQVQVPPSGEGELETQTQPQATIREATMPPPQKPESEK